MDVALNYKARSGQVTTCIGAMCKFSSWLRPGQIWQGELVYRMKIMKILLLQRLKTIWVLWFIELSIVSSIWHFKFLLVTCLCFYINCLWAQNYEVEFLCASGKAPVHKLQMNVLAVFVSSSCGPEASHFRCCRSIKFIASLLPCSVRVSSNHIPDWLYQSLSQQWAEPEGCLDMYTPSALILNLLMTVGSFGLEVA